jgi:crotonobetainyl-CoA:carnitine CoA-transferase CaiB-like acyl-CoA transferase
MVPYQVFRCLEGDIIIAVGNDSQYATFCSVIGQDHLACDTQFRTASDRNRNRDALIPIIAEAMRARTMKEWIQLLEARNVPCGPIHDLKQTLEDPQVQHRGLQLLLPHSTGMDAPALANPIRLSESPIKYRNAAPQLGEHNRQILQERLGLSADYLADLKDRNVV